MLGYPVFEVSPILLRPIREQLEHDRVIRQLQTRWRRRFEVAANVGASEEMSVRSGSVVCYPDLVLTTISGRRRLHGVAEVETAESVNHLEAMAEWSYFSKVRGAFYLYVPAGHTDIALRLCESGKINVTEIWAYYAFGSQAKFSLSYRSPRATSAAKAARLKTETTLKPRKAKAATQATAGRAKASKKAPKKSARKKVGKTTKKTVARKKTAAKTSAATRRTGRAAAKRKK